MSIEENKAVARRYFEEFSKGNLDAMKTLMAPNHLFHFPGSPEPMDREAHNQTQHMVLASFADWYIVIEDQIAEADKVVTRGVFGGTRNDEVFGTPSSGNTIRVPFINIMQIVDGLNVEEWDSWDSLGFLQQIGDVPTPVQSDD